MYMAMPLAAQYLLERPATDVSFPANFYKMQKAKRSRFAQISRFTHAHRPAKYPYATRRIARGQGTEAHNSTSYHPSQSKLTGPLRERGSVDTA